MVTSFPLPTPRPHAARRWRSLAALVACCAAVGCLPALPERGAPLERPDAQAHADASGDVIAPPACPPLLTGELLLNEVVVRPGGLDADGDGASTGRDEVIEVVSRAEGPAHALGVVVRIDGVIRGQIVASPCLQPGSAALLVGSTTADGGRVATLPTLRLDHTLRLRDMPSRIELVSSAGGIHDGASLPAALGNASAVWTRVPDAEPDGVWLAHRDVPPFRPWSLGSCAGGGQIPACLLPGRARAIGP